MTYPANTGRALVGMGYAGDGADFNARDAGGANPVVLAWFHPTDPQPTVQQIQDILSDTTALPNGQLFSVWDAENGGDATQTSRRQAKDATELTGGIGTQNRGLIQSYNMRDNYLINRVAELQTRLNALMDAIGNSTGPADAIRTAVNGVSRTYLATETRDRAEAIAAYKTNIDAGQADPS